MTGGHAHVVRQLLAMEISGVFSGNGALARGDAEAILLEAQRFATERLAPLNKVGDRNPARLIDGQVVTPPGWKEAYGEWCDGGWNSLTGPEAHGGQGLPMALAAATTEIWNGASIGFALCPLLTTGAIEAIAAHATEELKAAYLPNLVAGAWSGTMNLTEPQSGSDLSQLRCKARPQGDGSYRISGSKIYITYGGHDWTSNIIHLVLARLEGAPEGTRGISLFLVPQVLPDGSHNDVHVHGLEHKLGIHGSPTCSMVYGDRGGATGFLIGEENKGLACMFTMMNNARLLVGVQGVALAAQAVDMAFAHARQRRQGRGVDGAPQQVAIASHPDVKRMLLVMRARTQAARLLCMATAAAMDAGNGDLASLLTPLAKAYATDTAVDAASAAVQVHGGMGYIEETGVAQVLRDARILPIYEGTNGIQAIDLVTRKLGLAGGRVLDVALTACAEELESFGAIAAATQTQTLRTLATDLRRLNGSAHALAAATPFLHGLSATLCSGFLAKAARLARGGALAAEAETDARIFHALCLPGAVADAQAALTGADLVAGAMLA
jgi:acyl-CoA dehydrogenase